MKKVNSSINCSKTNNTTSKHFNRICGGKMMSKKNTMGPEKGWFGSIQN